ncbi:MAG TPA: carboxyl transferase domain-containing protein [Acidimicrobiales bacterium]|nr:carboxyl transferase domain-containing protein [Acidimicrobiales bacterium]
MPLHPLQTEWDAGLRGGDPLAFPGYSPPDGESVLTGRAVVPSPGRPEHAYALIEGRFDVMGGSMGAVHGERVVRAFRRATQERLPVVIVSASGGARMQEGMVSLVQMARTATASRAHARAGLLQVAVLRGPTTGGVYASYVSLADVRAAEPGATIGFAGPRVVELTTGERILGDSHTAEFAFRHGLVDALVARTDQARWVEAALGLRLVAAADAAPLGGRRDDISAEGAWGEVLRSRSGPHADAWAVALTESWTELRGADASVRAALATFEGRRVVVVATNRERRPTPAGYRLAQRAIALASRLGLPLVTFVDTPGADPRTAAEAGGAAGEIARAFAAMAELATPSVALVTGEGGSGGALALAFADRLLLLEHAVFSVIAPEGAAAILDRDASTAPARAGDLKPTAADLLAAGIIDGVIQESEAAVRKAIGRALDEAVAGDRTRRFDAATARWLR